MAVKLFKLAIASAVFACVGASIALAGPADDAINARRNCMKMGNGAMMKALSAIAKGETAYSNDAVQAALKVEGDACADWDKWWVAGTEKGETVETFAKPEAISDAKGFGEAGGVWYNAYVAVQKSTDEASFKAALPALGAGCQGCHEKYRKPAG